MVTRKAVPLPPVKTAPRPDINPPYPTSPVQPSVRTTTSTNSGSVYSTDLATSPAFDLIDVRDAQQQQRQRSDSTSSRDTWASDETEQEKETDAVPKPLNVRTTPINAINGDATDKGKGKVNELPLSLRIGKPAVSSPGHGYEEESQTNPWAGEQPLQSPRNTNNPYLKQNGFAVDGSQAVWQEVQPPVPSTAPPPPPSQAPPPPPPALSPQISNSPAHPASRSPSYGFPSAPPPPVQAPASIIAPERQAWQTAETLSVPQHGPPQLPPISGGCDRPSSTWWQDSESEVSNAASAAPEVPPKPAPPQDLHYHPPPGPPPSQMGTLIDHEDASHRPPPIQTTKMPSPPPTSATPETPGTMIGKQRNTTYQIKHVNWLDESYDGATRKASQLRNSPIMMQNANGPCPLLALVNALVLSAPGDVTTPLVETLRTREQISLGLLLDAVFDELTSTRRASNGGPLPDVSELYAFLLALHTGMNVNPRFVTPATTPRGSWDGVPPELSGMHPIHRAQHKAGAFEETKEMKLYSTFKVPLIHGWIAPSETPSYEAFARSAPTFEDAQNIQFLESDLEEKMRNQGLTAQETQQLDDIHTIKSFLNTWPTQLTDYGLETMSRSLQPGQIAILFRNDHFSTLYKEPKHGALMTLVTDAGYATHDEVVWESLVDVSGAAGEMFSGDFRVVSHGSDVRLNQGNSGGGEEGWTMVTGKGRGKASAGESPPPLPGPRPPNAGASHDEDVTTPMTDAQRRAAEQQDHDLALALQLQEEEENHQREAEERRRREQELSEQFLSNESEGPRPPIPPRRSQGRGTGVTAGARAPVTRSSELADDPDAPPSYEQSASDQPYRPAGATAAGGISQGNAIGAYDALRRQQSAYAAQSSATTGSAPSPPYTATASGSSPSNPRRASGAPPNRIKRNSQTGGFGPGLSTPNHQRMPSGQGGLSPIYQQGNQQGRAMQRVPTNASNNQAATVRDAEERCCIM